MRIELEDIPDIDLLFGEEQKWKVKTCHLGGAGNLVLKKLTQWRDDPEMEEEYEQIIANIVVTACSEKIESDTPFVKKNANPENGEVYEFRAFNEKIERAGKARVLFFYDEEDRNLIVCTNTFEKGQGDQNMSFRQCALLKQLYMQ
ncbi:MAG TPA: hypothetical protein VJ904_01455, partial [Tichowtungia sp.]|nr:hypothetical protein [Tichowtungia sp.]